MLEFSSSAEDLRRVFGTATRLSEGKSILQVGADVILVSPCQEGAIVQRLEAESVTGEGDLAVSPHLLERAANFLSPFTGRFLLRAECGELLLSSKSSGASSCIFQNAVRSAEETYSTDWLAELGFQVSGLKLRDALRQAVPAPVELLPETTLDATAALLSKEGRIEIFGSNSVLGSWTVIETPATDTLAPILLPPGLVRKALELHDLWRGKIAISRQGFLSNSDCFVLWSPEEVKRRSPAILASPRDLWTKKALLSAWLKVSELLSVAENLKKPRRPLPPACRMSWDTTSVTFLPIVEGSDRESSELPDHRNAHSSGLRLGTVKPVLAEPGSLVLPTVVFELLSGMLGSSECQMKATENCVLLGSPRGFLALRARHEGRPGKPTEID